MKVAIIGNGNVGSGLANVLSKTKHEVGTFGRADDVSNAVTEDFSALQLGTTMSAAEVIAALVPGASVVKAFNTIFAQHYA